MAKKKELPEIEELISESQQVAAEFDSEIFIPDSFQSTQQDLSDRQALRRVIGLSTELSDISEAEYRQLRLERVILVGVWTEGSVKDAENSMEELAALAETAGSTVLDALIQRRDKPDPATFIGSGKVSELKAIVKSTGADTVVCDGELSPSQLRNLEDKVKVKVVDRTALILDIFSQRAQTAEGQLQVELAQLEYQMPRLTKMWSHLERQGGRGNVKGMGEKQIEVDKRLLRERKSLLGSRIESMRTPSVKNLISSGRSSPSPSIGMT